jgi:hypothetical protein
MSIEFFEIEKKIIIPLLSFMQSSKNLPKGILKSLVFELYSKHAVAMVAGFQHKSSKLQCSGGHCECVQ